MSRPGPLPFPGLELAPGRAAIRERRVLAVAWTWILVNLACCAANSALYWAFDRHQPVFSAIYLAADVLGVATLGGLGLHHARGLLEGYRCWGCGRIDLHSRRRGILRVRWCPSCWAGLARRQPGIGAP